MSDNKIEPSKVTKPIQLLAAWLTGLIIINGSFLAAAVRIENPTWASGLLVAAAVLNVPIFLVGLFLLQTKFRPEMQEDEFYSRYLEKRYSVDSQKEEFIEVVSKGHSKDIVQSTQNISDIAKEERFDLGAKSTEVHINDLLPCFNIVSEKLIECKIPIESIFGSTSKEPKAPNIFHVSFGREVDPEILKQVLLICGKYGLESISYANTETTAGKIYIGSFGYTNKKRKNLVMSQDLIADIETNKVGIHLLKSIILTKGISNVSTKGISKEPLIN